MSEEERLKEFKEHVPEITVEAIIKTVIKMLFVENKSNQEIIEYLKKNDPQFK